MAALPTKICLLAAMLVLSACAAPHSSTDSYISRTTGIETPIETNREACIRRCNGEFDRCGDKESTRRAADPFPRDLFGAAADCRATLRNCLNACKGR